MFSFCLACSPHSKLRTHSRHLASNFKIVTSAYNDKPDVGGNDIMTGGAASVIHSIYGRQLSNLVFATPDGDAGGESRASSSPATKLLVRPKSSPAGRKAVRPRSAALPLTTVRTRPGSAAARSTTAPRGRGGGGKVRPKTAAGTRLLQGEHYVHDLEERDDVETRAQLKGPSTPVSILALMHFSNPPLP